MPLILLINKIDKLKDKSQLLPLIAASQNIYPFNEIIPISAINVRDKNKFLSSIVAHIPDGPPGFPKEQVTNRSEKFMASELIREQIFSTLGQELPYAIATEITKFEINEKEILHIEGVIWVEKPGQKSIVIGKGGQQLKELGTRTRLQMEKIFKCKVYLNLWVKVKKGWG